jgi:hypothetical protein
MAVPPAKAERAGQSLVSVAGNLVFHIDIHIIVYAPRAMQ